ncbi:hypothetical protein HGRIS_010730 [Hohenbuehelia grisea]|uniref:mRNA 3'-end-processing protein RNA14 n=1 Tax=Hohenbuehelia grisea TaxID=104357 RepID=A0ABR3IXW5_9AGAR
MEQDSATDFETLKQRLKDKPQDPSGWLRLINFAEASRNFEQIKVAYDLLLDHYPNTVSAEIAYFSHFRNDYPYLEELFRRFLLPSLSVELWKFYLSSKIRFHGHLARDAICKAYEYTLKSIGQDYDSGDIWMDYIAFVKAVKASSNHEEQQKISTLRNIYYRAVRLPIKNAKKLWKDLEVFEKGISTLTASKIMNNLLPAHNQACKALPELETHIRLLRAPQSPHQAGRLVLPSVPTYSDAERSLIGAWKAYLKWEENNPLQFEKRDSKLLVSRVQIAYRNAFVAMRYYPEIWFMAHTWRTKMGMEDEALSVLETGVKTNPASFLLNFALAEAQERKGKFSKARETYEDLLGTLGKQLDELVLTLSKSSDARENPFKDVLMSGQRFENQLPKSQELSDRRAEYGTCRKDRWTSWQAYDAMAMLEYHCFDNKAAAVVIFEGGMELFADDLQFVLQYLAFLLNTRDAKNARTLFDRVAVMFPPDDARQLWDFWARHEYQYGDLEVAQTLEKRIAETYPTDTLLKRFAQRHTYFGVDPIALRDLGFALVRATAASASTSNSGQQLGRANNGQAFDSPSSDYKRAPTPEYNARDHGGKSPPTKRKRGRSPPRQRLGNRDRRDGPAHYHNIPARGRDKDRARETEPSLPSILPWFLSQLPGSSSFDGPILPLAISALF